MDDVVNDSGHQCGRRFPKIWNSFVHAFIDSIHAGGAPTAPRPTTTPSPDHLPTVLPAAKRLIAIGDLHGDLTKTQRAFQLAGLTDAQHRWVGGTNVAVQVGDILDRGDQEIEIFYFLERLQHEAAAAGGALHVLTGNHETMNVAGQFRYATPGGFHSFKQWAETHALEVRLKGACGCAKAELLHKALGIQGTDGVSARVAALSPGGEITRRFLARHPTVLQVGATLFVHGGLLPQHAQHGPARINEETQKWMLDGPVRAKPAFLSGRHAVVWAREYSIEDDTRCDCDALNEALKKVPGAERMVVGHTIQDKGINEACDGRVIRVDVGMSSGCGGSEPEVLEILDDKVVRRLYPDSNGKTRIEVLDHKGAVEGGAAGFFNKNAALLQAAMKELLSGKQRPA